MNFRINTLSLIVYIRFATKSYREAVPQYGWPGRPSARLECEATTGNSHSGEFSSVHCFKPCDRRGNAEEVVGPDRQCVVPVSSIEHGSRTELVDVHP